MSTIKAPRFILAPGWGANVDPYNWTLMKQSTGEKATWSPVGYFSSPESLLKGLYRQFQAHPNDTDTLDEHLSASLAAAKAAQARFSGYLMESSTVKEFKVERGFSKKQEQAA